MPRMMPMVCRVVVALSLCYIVNALNPAEIHGYKFFDSATGDEIVIRGVDYYPRPNEGDLNQNSVDYYTDNHRHIWQRDIPHFEDLGVNAIRLYAVDAHADHDAFMCALEAAGIYVIVALAHDCPTCAVTRDQAPDCYPPDLKTQGQAVINAFAKYPNTLAFSAGNEVNHFTPLDEPEWNAPCQKKFIRDMRQYVDSCSFAMRKVPIGVIVADSDREQNAMYYNCQGDKDEFETAEWYGLNSYVFCNGKAETYDEALGLISMQEDFESYKYSIPVLLTEFGCISASFPTIDGYAGQRNFNQARWMLERPELRDQFAGGFAFEYSMEKVNAGAESPYPSTTFGHQNYGIGYFEPEHCDDVEQRCSYHPLPSFYNLKRIYTETAIVNITNRDALVVGLERQNYTSCPERFPSLGSFMWEADSTRSLACPPRREFSLTCSGPFRVHIDASPGLSHLFAALLAFAILIGALACTLGRNVSYVIPYHMDFEDDSSQMSEVSTDESAGLLLSMKPPDSNTPYMSIGSDSSSDSLTNESFKD